MGRKRNNTHALPITRQLWAVYLQAGSFISVLSVVLFRVNAQEGLKKIQHCYLSIHGSRNIFSPCVNITLSFNKSYKQPSACTYKSAALPTTYTRTHAHMHDHDLHMRVHVCACYSRQQRVHSTYDISLILSYSIRYQFSLLLLKKNKLLIRKMIDWLREN